MPVADIEMVTGSAGHVDSKAASEYGTDLRRWRLKVHEGRHMWEYVDEDVAQTQQQTFAENYWLGQEYELPKMSTPIFAQDALDNGWAFFKRLQTQDGHWGCHDDGPLFVTSGIVISSYICGITLPDAMKNEMIRYLLNFVNEDGGWGLWINSPSTVFGTTMNYTMLRILGVPSTHPALLDARDTLLKMGSARALPTWGKFWMCALGAYEWDGMIPLAPEPLLAPGFLPLNPGNWWVHTRNVFVSMSYLFGHRFSAPMTPLIQELREELYDMPYHKIDWFAQQTNISDYDRLHPPTMLQKGLANALCYYEYVKVPYLRRKALDEALFQVEMEVHNTSYLCIAPVSFASNMLVMFHAHGANSHWVKGMADRIIDPMWMCREGMAASGTNGTSVWDTALTVQAALDGGLAQRPENHNTMLEALKFIEVSQITENPLGVSQGYRQPTKGAWPFSTRDQAYAVSDTTAVTVRAVIQLQALKSMPKLVSDERLAEAVDLIIGMENKCDGYSAFEPLRGPKALELLNITELYDNVMTESLYPECTSSVLLCLDTFTKAYPHHRPVEIQSIMARCARYLIKAQFPCGGWLASWGVCFTYATMFALQGLETVGLRESNSETCRNACSFLLQYQNDDGGWGEDLISIREKRYIQDPAGSQVTCTAYALMGLISAHCSNRDALRRGIRWLMRAQQATGEWLPGSLEGIFACPGGMRYPNYKFHFTLSAIGRYIERYGDEALYLKEQ
ncbi:lanosterol synthase [Nannizzia gypsea CBS 118893]|uniref:Protostadienol synthase A n=1 Tax=Arthroderma gypseum (strain ATCC MYA-4604 / CBS 118893) TaxID=535722 RepID=PDSA_ARTGP|nr:lanosterol synthase [Nannizzia gypsea CBS 118893]E4V6I8.1 RecName: Full=Protostadienol synthase A [Nannizzia gypsea CBS 118893]EFQ96704.1 lanosterol synthase [Nannizzia gypsea CBS 118893]